ncbi:MAG TPA: hypothetical protein PKB06_08375, partial [Actinotalea sp.]|nr:hypothetical protein [Actinotalea sp.]
MVGVTPPHTMTVPRKQKPTWRKGNRRYAGVSLEPHVIEYVDDLAARMGMSRSWVLGTIVQEYAKLIEASTSSRSPAVP